MQLPGRSSPLSGHVKCNHWQAPDGLAFFCRTGKGTSALETILLVDDEPSVLRLCYQILNLDGYRVLQATSGEDALRQLQRHTAGLDLALLDVIMPGMNGIELAKRIQAIHPETPIILMTGYGPHEIARVVGENNPYRIIWKPFKAGSLRQMVENVINSAARAPSEPIS
jgi:two-component system cell cycle sensor histidine kinase/response regulator CckA